MQRNHLELLQHINPSLLSYQEWVNVGMALKQEGYTASDWDSWSAQDNKRYHQGECFKKWDGFAGNGNPVTGGTIFQLAIEQGWTPPEKTSHELNWDDEIGKDYKLIDEAWLEVKEINEPDDTQWNPVKELITYLETLFESTENVGYVTEVWEKDDKYMPGKGSYDRTAGQLIEALSKCNGDIGAVIGDYKEEAGAWIRFNPLDGKGVKNENVTDYRYTLVESDSMELEKQNAIIRELELPVACLVYSGGKSIHAIVKVDANTYDEYRKRVDYIYSICKKNGLDIDSQNRNPSRLSRMPGIRRDGRKQFLIGTNLGKGSYEDWYKYIEDLNDDLPDPEGLEGCWDDMPELAPELIHGVLRQGHKMLIAGPSKAGKSFALIEMCIAIAEGTKWLNWQCSQGRVLYVNLELDRASCLHRFKDVYNAVGIKPQNIGNIDIWNLRGKTVPMDKLAPKLIRRALKKGYIAVIIDPIYKVLTGDENSADQMAHFTNQFDKVATELGSSVIYCHHHSKGAQGNKKSLDRASGSGVFARDPDALIDLIELELTEEIYSMQLNQAKCKVFDEAIRSNNPGYYDEHVGLDDALSLPQITSHANRALTQSALLKCSNECNKVEDEIRTLSAWRVSGTLREFAKFKPVNMWFRYPKHEVDEAGILTDIETESAQPTWKKAIEERKKNAKEQKEEQLNEFEIAFTNLEMDGEVLMSDLAEALGLASHKQIGLWLGNGKQARSEYKKRYETYTGADGQRYIKRRE
jgi:RecA-family ATPase